MSLWLGGCTARESGKEAILIPIPQENELIRIRPREVYFRDLELEAGDFVQLVAHQRGIDVRVRLVGPDGKEMISVDSPNGTEGPEELVEIARASGVHRFEVIAPEKDVDPGEFVFEELARRRAAADDRELVATDHEYHEARRLLKMKRQHEAISKLQGALDTWLRLREQPRREADTRYALYQAYHALAEWDLALAYCEQALGLYRSLDDPLLTGVALTKVGSIRQQFGQMQHALRSFEEAQAIFEAAGLQRETYLSLTYLGSAHHRVGNYRKALNHFEHALSQLERSSPLGTDHAGVLLNLGVLLLNTNQPLQALDRLTVAEEIYRQLEDRHQQARALSYIANAAFRAGEIDRAERQVEEAITIFGALGVQDRNLAISYCVLGRVLQKKNKFDRARYVLQEALRISRREQDRQIEATALMELGYLLVLEKEPEAGLQELNQARAAFSEIDDLTGQAIVSTRCAEALRDLNRLEEAWERISPALEVPEGLRTASERSDLRTGYFAFRQDFYEIAIDILMGLHAREPEAGHHLRAFEVHERRLARELLDVLAEAPVTKDQQVDSTLLAEEHRLEEELREITLTSETAGLNEKIRKIVDQLHRVRGAIRQAKRANATELPTAAPVGIEQILRSVLDADSLILAYALGETRSYLWSISQDEVQAHQLPPRRIVEGLARHFAEQSQTQANRIPQTRARIAQELSELLLAPIDFDLGTRRLLVVPDGALQRIPFAALPAPQSAKERDFLIYRHEIVMLPSISAVVSLRRAEARREPPKRGIAAFADPVFRDDDPRIRDSAGDSSSTLQMMKTVRDLDRMADRLGFDPYKRLPASRAEIDAILAVAPQGSHLLATDFLASRRTFEESELHDFRILHFATHAFQDQEHPELSGLVLSLIDEKGREQDGFLRAFEISRLHLPVELVVLSACQTGRGKSVPGEGVMGLTRAFLVAGASRVISSLWRVSDRSTARLMTDFYNAHLKAELPPAAALRQAQLAMLESPEFREPRHWAGFVFQGEWLPSPQRLTRSAEKEKNMKNPRSIEASDVGTPDPPVTTLSEEKGDVEEKAEHESGDAAEEAQRLLKESE